MNGIHDMGGMDGFGPVRRETNEAGSFIMLARNPKVVAQQIDYRHNAEPVFSARNCLKNSLTANPGIPASRGLRAWGADEDSHR